MRTLYDMLPDYDTATLCIPQRNEEGELDLARFALATEGDIVTD